MQHVYCPAMTIANIEIRSVLKRRCGIELASGSVKYRVVLIRITRVPANLIPSLRPIHQTKVQAESGADTLHFRIEFPENTINATSHLAFLQLGHIGQLVKDLHGSECLLALPACCKASAGKILEKLLCG